MDTPVTTKAALLQCLCDGEGYGLDLIERAKQYGLNLHAGSVYPALRELEGDGFLKSYEGEPMPERGGRPRRYYKLTAAGKKLAAKQKQDIRRLFN